MRLPTMRLKASQVPQDTFVYLEDEHRFFFVDDMSVDEEEVTFFFEEDVDESGIVEYSKTVPVNQKMLVVSYYNIDLNSSKPQEIIPEGHYGT